MTLRNNLLLCEIFVLSTAYVITVIAYEKKLRETAKVLENCNEALDKLIDFIKS